MDEFSNDLDDAQTERLAILAEECGEVIQMVGKILRHGYQSYNPTLPPMQQKPNSALLEKEIGDLLWAISRLDNEADINFQIPRTSAQLNMWLRRKDASAAPYLHHQPTRAPSPVPAPEPVREKLIEALRLMLADYQALGTYGEQVVIKAPCRIGAAEESK